LDRTNRIWPVLTIISIASGSDGLDNIFQDNRSSESWTREQLRHHLKKLRRIPSGVSQVAGIGSSQSTKSRSTDPSASG
jgi:hypothetical protein